MNKNTILITVVSVLLIGGFLVGAYMLTNQPAQQADTTVYAKTATVQPNDHIQWSPNKKIILTEYADFQCPACLAAYEYMKSNIDNDPQITKNVTYIYRYFPLFQIHKNAYNAAYAADAAGKQNKFFQMGDLMFNHQNDWAESNYANDYFIKYAQQLKLNIDQFKKDMKSQDAKDHVQRDYDSGVEATVDSTPTFFLNGKKLTLTSFSDLRQALLDAIKAQ